MKPRRLPSGSWNVRITIKGQTYSFTDPDKKTVMRLASEFADKQRDKVRNPTLAQACEDFITEREKTLSPSTLRSYRGIVKKITERNPAIMQKKVIALTDMDILNIVRPLRTVKTKRNYLNFLQVATGKKYDINLSGKASHEIAVPTDLEVMGLLAIFGDTEMEIPVMLGAFGGLRRGEICALTMQDIDGDYVHITKSMVKAPDRSWVIKSPKTPKSVRRVLLPHFVVERIQKQGYVTHLLPCNISDRFWKTQLRLGIERPYCFHSLRHYSASYLHSIGIPDAYIMERGGWSTPHVMQKVYRHALADKVDPIALKAVSAFQNTFQY
jgi:integrase